MLWFPANERATAVGINQSAVNVSGMLGAAIMPWLAVTYSWQAGFVFAAGLAFVVCVVAVLFYRDPRPGESPGAAQAPVPVSEIDQGLPAVTGDEATDRAIVRGGFAAVLRSRDIWMMGLAALFLGVVEFAALAHLVLFLNTDWGYSVAVAAGMLAFCQFAGALGKPLSGLVSDRPLHRRRVPALLGMGTLAGLSCVAFALLQPGHTWLLWGALFLLGFGAVGWGGLMGTLAGETGGHRSAGAAAGVSAAFFNVGIFLGPPVFGVHRRPHRLVHTGVVDDGRLSGRGPRAAALRPRGPHGLRSRRRRSPAQHRPTAHYRSRIAGRAVDWLHHRSRTEGVRGCLDPGGSRRRWSVSSFSSSCWGCRRSRGRCLRSTRPAGASARTACVNWER